MEKTRVMIAPGLDAWLGRRGVQNPVVRAVVRIDLLFSTLFLLAGAGLFFFTQWLFWFAIGHLLMAMTFWGLARQFPDLRPGDWDNGVLLRTIFRWLARMLLATLVIYVAIVLCKAPAVAILSGLTLALAVGTVTWLLVSPDIKAFGPGGRI